MDLLKIITHYDSLFPKSVNISVEGMDYVGEAEKNFDELGVSFMEIQPYLQETMDYIEAMETTDKERNKTGRDISFNNIPLCAVDPYYWSFFKVINEEKVNYIASNDENKTGEELTKLITEKNNYEECKACKVNKFCNGCWPSAYLHIKDLLRPCI